MMRPTLTLTLLFLVSVAIVGASLVLLPVGAATDASPTASSTFEDEPLELEFDDAHAIQPTVGAGAYAASSPREFDSTTYEITIHENGDATWTFRHERVLDDADAESAFEEFAEEFEDDETDLYLSFVEQAEELTALGADETDREMEATDFNRSASVEQRFNTEGVVEMSFRWSGFATVDDDGTVTAGDVFAGGFYILSDQTLVIQADDALAFSSVHPEGEYSGSTLEESQRVTWPGEREFLDGQPRVVLEPQAANETGAAEGSDSSATDRSVVWLALAGVVVIVAVGAVLVARRRRLPRPNPPATDSQPNATTASSRDSSEASVDPISDDELRSDEDRVVSMIEQNGGRMKQVDIVDQTGWSKSKVSMLLSDMETEGTISKLRVGRENIISLEGFEPEAAKSPFEE